MVETKFKQTEIGLIPEDWEVKVFTDIFDFLSTASYSRADLRERGEIGYIHYGDIHTKIGYHLDTNEYVSGFISKTQLKTYSLVQQGDLIMADASEDYSGVGKSTEIVNIPTKDAISGLHTFLIREKHSKLALGFKGYFHSNPLIKKQYDALATGLKVYSLSKSSFKNILIPLPPLPEQQAIAETLSDTNAWIESLEKLIAKKRSIKQGAMQQLLTPKEDWEEKEIQEVANVIGGATPSTQNKSFWNGYIDWFTPTEVGNTKYLNSSLRKITDFGLLNCSAKILPIGTVLLTTRAGIGDLGILRNPASTNQGFQSLVPLENINGEFLYYLASTLKQKLLQNASGSTFLEISPSKVKTLQISLPPLPEQTRIATILSDMDAEVEALEQKLTKAHQIKQGMMQELLTGRIRLISSSTIEEQKPQIGQGHNEHFNDAVLIGAMASCFGSEKFPLTRFKYTKVSYLLKRYKEEQDAGYLKHAAGPYKSKTRYGGAEKIALGKKYVDAVTTIYKGKEYEGFVASEGVDEALKYFNEWYGKDAPGWIMQYKFETNDNLELWTTVDMAIEELKRENKSINVESIKQIIKDDKEWRAKLKKPIFSDINIQKTIVKLDTLFI